MKEIERKLERKEREERRKHIVIRGVEVKNERREEVVEEVLKSIGAEVKIAEVKRLGSHSVNGERKMIWARL